MLTLPLLHEKHVRARAIGPNVLAVSVELSLTSSQGSHNALLLALERILARVDIML